MRGIPAWLSVPARWQTVIIDVLLTIALFGIAVSLALPFSHTIQPPFTRVYDAYFVALLAVQHAPLLLRRRVPAWGLLVSVGAVVLQFALGYPPNTSEGSAAAVLIWSVGMYASRAAIAVTVLSLPAVSAVVRHSAGVEITPQSVLGLSFLMGCALIAGVLTRRALRRQYRLGIEVERAIAEQERQVVEAVAAERAVIGRDLHDAVAQSLSHILVEAVAGGRAADGDPHAQRRAWERVSASAEDGLFELRRLIGLLSGLDEHSRGAAALASNRHSLWELPVLVDRARARGVSVVLMVDDDAAELVSASGSSVWNASVYRIVQECLNNTMKHAGSGADARIDVKIHEGIVHLTMVDWRRGPKEPGQSVLGRGLIGMRERAALLGGELEAGPYGEGWRVHLRVPLPPAGHSATLPPAPSVACGPR